MTEKKLAWIGLAVLAALGLGAPRAAAACELALALVVDVSGSVDGDEYDIQMQGLANGLRDGVVSEALVKARAAILLVQWTGSGRQAVSVPWTTVTTFNEVEALAQRVDTTERRWRNYSTAIGDALASTLSAFTDAPPCARRVIDLSGDGVSNEGAEPRSVLAAMRAADITINALAIEGNGEDLTGYYWENVISGEGAFVVSAAGFAEYSAKMKLKLRREVTAQLAMVAPGVPSP